MLFGAAAVLSLIFGYLLPYLAYRPATRPQTDGCPREQVLAGMLPDQLVTNTIGGFPIFAGALALVLGRDRVRRRVHLGHAEDDPHPAPGRGSLSWRPVPRAGRRVAVWVLGIFALGAVQLSVIAPAKARRWTGPRRSTSLRGSAAGWLVLMMWAWPARSWRLLRNVALPIGLGVVWILGIENLVSAMAARCCRPSSRCATCCPGSTPDRWSAAMPTRPPRRRFPSGRQRRRAPTGRALVTVACYVVVCLAVALMGGQAPGRRLSVQPPRDPRW